ncbi:Alpha-aminoadipate--LysW ligase LysX [bacterium HR30]|nr:Alpha-aminoadipate--LysW ligase LysX [bacterium HR30]
MKAATIHSRLFAPWVDPIVRDLAAAAKDFGGEIESIVLDDLLPYYRVREDVERLYVLPCLAPNDTSVAELVRSRLPHARPLVPFEVQDLCWDKIATQKRLIERGIAAPETLITDDADEVARFVKHHTYAILKEPAGCAGAGHWVLWFEAGTLMADNGFAVHRVVLGAPAPARIVDGELRYPPPYYVQRLVGTFTRYGFEIGQVLRAYVVDEEIPFWSERYRERYRRPGDWILNVARGAKYRFVLSVSEETKNVAFRAARAVGARVAAVDLVRTSKDGPLVLEVNTDGCHMYIDRSFKDLPEYRDFFDLDRYIARAVLSEEESVGVRSLRSARRKSKAQPRRRR